MILLRNKTLEQDLTSHDASLILMLSEKTKDEKRKHDVKTGPAKAGNNPEMKPNKTLASPGGFGNPCESGCE